MDLREEFNALVEGTLGRSASVMHDVKLCMNCDTNVGIYLGHEGKVVYNRGHTRIEFGDANLENLYSAVAQMISDDRSGQEIAAEAIYHMIRYNQDSDQWHGRQ